MIRWRARYGLLLLIAFALLSLPVDAIAQSGVVNEQHALQGSGTAGANTPSVTFEPVITGIEMPMLATNAGDGSGRLFIVENSGRIHIATGGSVLGVPFLDITHRVRSDHSETGLLSLAFHPNYAANGLFYVYFTSVEDTNSLVRYQVSASDPNQADPESAKVILALPDRFPQYHNGGTIAFGPDGYLYLSTGDEGTNLDEADNAQSRLSLYGKLLRLDVDNGDPYAIPPDNPFVGLDDARPEIWASGLRNPWRFSFDRLTSDIYIGDVGQETWEEVNFQPAASSGGENYGWNRMEGTHCFPLGSDCNPSPFVLPVTEYDHGDGEHCAVIGGHVYRGTLSPALTGAYLFADVCSGQLWSLRRDGAGDWVRTPLTRTDMNITSFGEDEAGEIYVTTFQSGAVWRIAATGDNPTPVVWQVSPAAASADTGVAAITVTGDYFLPGATVYWDGQPLPTAFINATELEVIDTTAIEPTPGNAMVTVVNPGPGGGASNAGYVRVTPGATASDAIQRTWDRTDQPVDSGQASRTWMWGNELTTQVIAEEYAESPAGRRAVWYFDKARMEVTNPDGDPQSEWYVTNGLLVVEMVTGELQIGDQAFESREPAEVNIAGDPDDAAGPTYATMALVLDASPASPDGSATYTQRIDRNGVTSDDPALSTYDIRPALIDPVTGHSIATPFWEFMNSSGPIFVDGDYLDERLFTNPYYGTGRPITEPYWAAVKVGGEVKEVLNQCFERRCMTFTPGNQTGWQVEAGNVGLHYFSWRYGEISSLVAPGRQCGLVMPECSIF